MAPPPPGPTLRALVELLGQPRAPRAISLGAYSMTAQLVRDGDGFQLFELYDGVAGVSPLDDRRSKVGALVFEAHGIDDLIGKLVCVWTADFGTLLAERERLYARVKGDRARLLIELRQRWTGGLSLTDAPAVLDGQRALDATRARCVAEMAAATGATIAWQWSRFEP